MPLDALANRLVLPLLGLLVERPAHPYELTARLNERYRFLTVQRSSVTTLVKSLAAAGLFVRSASNAWASVRRDGRTN